MITLRMGSRGLQVKQLQNLLRIEADGIFGNATYYAVVAYQKKYGKDEAIPLTVDGVVGVSTWTSLLARRSGEKYRDIFHKPQQDANMWNVDPMLGTLFKDSSRNRRMLSKGIALLKPHADEFHLNTPTRLAHFVAQIREEVGYNITVTENLNYSCNALKSTFKAYRKNPNLAQRHGRCDGHPSNPYSIARVAYGGRMGNKPYPDHEGYVYKGRGCLMTTGKNNYRELDDYLRDHFPQIYINFKPLKSPHLLSTEDYWLLSGAVFWKVNSLYDRADIGLTELVSNLITDRINRYTDSHDSRYRHLKSLTRIYT